MPEWIKTKNYSTQSSVQSLHLRLAATAAFLALKKHRCAEQKLIEEIDDIVSEKEPEEVAKEEPQAEVTADELAEEE